MDGLSIFKDKTQAEIFATEITMDMSMLVYMLSRKSETEKMSGLASAPPGFCRFWWAPSTGKRLPALPLSGA